LQDKNDLQLGDKCTVNGHSDLRMDGAAKPFIGELCIFNGINKGGLYKVILASNPKQCYSVPKKNISTVPPEFLHRDELINLVKRYQLELTTVQLEMIDLKDKLKKADKIVSDQEWQLDQLRNDQFGM